MYILGYEIPKCQIATNFKLILSVSSRTLNQGMISESSIKDSSSHTLTGLEKVGHQVSLFLQTSPYTSTSPPARRRRVTFAFCRQNISLLPRPRFFAMRSYSQLNVMFALFSIRPRAIGSSGLFNQIRKASSKRWQARQQKDQFTREAAVQGLKSRAAFKLLQVRTTMISPESYSIMYTLYLVRNKILMKADR